MHRGLDEDQQTSAQETQENGSFFNWDVKLCLVVLRVAIDLNCSFKSSEQASLLPRYMVLKHRWCQKGCQPPLLFSNHLWAIASTSSFLLFSGPWAGQAFQPAQLAQHCSATFPASHLFYSYSRNVILCLTQNGSEVLLVDMDHV